MIIEVDLSGVVSEELMASLTPEAINAVLADIGAAARNHWIGLAQKGLNTSRNDYVASIQQLEIKGSQAIISLVGQPANIIERGSKMVDMREWLLGPRVPVAPPGQKGKRRSKSGHFYRAIPFRHATPGTAGSVGAPMGNPYSGVVKNSAELGQKVYRAARQLKATTARGGKTAYGGRLEAGLAPKLKDHHKTDIYAGMVRLSQKYQAATQNQYMTWRTISGRFLTGWVRKQTVGKSYSKKTQDFVKRIAPLAIQAYVDNVSRGLK